MKKLILFLPYTIYQFLKKYSKTEYVAYTNSLMWFIILILIYLEFLFPQFLHFVLVKPIENILMHFRFLNNLRLAKYIGYFLFAISIFVFLKKTTLDNLRYNEFQIRVIYILSTIIIWLPPILLIISLVKAF
ncbi:hypothetical protein ACF3NR_08740 [Vaginella massiliensis]|uniref:hypothetical protein n=1 Tax=Flavobacteriales TaxID=200644 RepID=UPI000838DBFE|nr:MULTISPECIES: hypothetical protein [Flavobacteriales]MDK7375078.1 hypothetical protein [Weeksella virosa]SUP53538.1 Uncharacterised protein [Weeksella virosa]